jgi:hypothetical protein
VLVGAFAALRAILPSTSPQRWAFDAAATMFLVSVAPLCWRGFLSAMRASAARDDGGRVLLLGISAIFLAVILTPLALVVGGQTKLGHEGSWTHNYYACAGLELCKICLCLHYAHAFLGLTINVLGRVL